MERNSQITKFLSEAKDLAVASEHSWVLILLFVTALAYSLLRRRDGPDLSHIPILRKELGGIDALKAEYGKKGIEMLEEGYHKVYPKS